MKRKQRIHISLAVLAVVIVAVILFLFLKIYKGNLIPVSTELSQNTKSFFQDIGMNPAEENKYVIIANNKFVTDSGKMTLSSDPDENIFVLSSNERQPTEIRILEQPQGANLVKGIGVGANKNVGISLPLPGTYRFGLKNNQSTFYTLTVLEPQQ